MSGIAGSNLNIRGSGVVAQLGTDGQVLTSSGVGVTAAFEDIAAGISWQSVVTGSSMTAVAGNGYWINTTSNACAITLPSSASAGDQIIFADYARYWGTNSITIDSNDLNYQGEANWTIEYDTDGTILSLVYMDATNGWIPTLDKTVADAPVQPVLNNYGIFGFGTTAAGGITNLVNASGVVATDTAAVGTARQHIAATEFGNDKAIFAYGNTGGSNYSSLSNLVSNTGVVATDVSGVGTARSFPQGAVYGGTKGVFAYGNTGSATAVKNLVSDSGVVATDVTGVGTARFGPGACEYSADKDKAIFAYGSTGSLVSVSNLVSNTGTVATDTTGVGTARRYPAACDYGEDKAIFGFGYDASSNTAVTNLVSNVGVIATDVSGVGTGRSALGATQYGLDKGIFAFGNDDADVSMSNLVSNSGVIASDVTGVGTARYGLGACSFN